MTTNWLTTMKPNFTNEWAALPAKEARQVLTKIKMLEQDPTPDAKVKKQLQHLDQRLYRIRSGDYRIFYTFEQPYISLLALRRRQDDTYDEDFDVEFLGGFNPQIAATSQEPAWLHPQPQQETATQALPETITAELLTNLGVPVRHHDQLLAIHSGDELLNCPSVPHTILDRLLEHMFPRPLAQVMQEPDVLLQDIDDLQRFKAGELLGFLLKLAPEQEKYVNWALNASGPTLLKGGPGTGKSTIALYRVRSLVQELRKEGRTDFRILFTTYTNALARSSEQLLRQLLGKDISYIDVRTADSIAVALLTNANALPALVKSGESAYLLQKAIAAVQFEGNKLQQETQRQAIERLNLEYLRQEIMHIIIARQLPTLEAYLAASRTGRLVRLNALQRRAIWQVSEVFQDLLKQQGKVTWQQLRCKAEQYVAQGLVNQTTYDAVLIDEAQDLDPSALRLLVRLCARPNRLFITADANQSIYGSGFNWADVHIDLRFQGRTAVLHANYRSTRQIGEAAQSYLAAGQLDTEPVERMYVNTGAIPPVRAVHNSSDEAQLLAHYITATAREFRLSVGACAILCPNSNVGIVLATALQDQGITATFMSSRELDLEQPGVKILTITSSKGLEFPIVALAGFPSNYESSSATPKRDHTAEREEHLAKNRRLIFVGMTRAMRALLVIVPAATQSPLLTNFDSTYWNLT